MCLFLTAPAVAQTIFKCVGADGVKTFQQTPCDKQEHEVGQERYAPDKRRPKPAYTYREPQQQPVEEVYEYIDYGTAQSPELQMHQSGSESGGEFAERARASSEEFMAELRQQAGRGPEAEARQAQRREDARQLVLDERGMPIPGAVKVAPNRYLDPRTGTFFNPLDAGANTHRVIPGSR